MINKNSGILRKTGDKGFTDLFSGEKISKASLRLEALGNLDELVAVLGVARANAAQEKIKRQISDIQKDLFIVGSELATNTKKLSSLPRRIDNPFLKNFERGVKSLFKNITLPAGFIIPGDSPRTVYLHQARTVARRLERSVVRLYNEKQIQNPNLLTFLNRLSVYLYLMAMPNKK